MEGWKKHIDNKRKEKKVTFNLTAFSLLYTIQYNSAVSGMSLTNEPFMFIPRLLSTELQVDTGV